MPRSTRKPLYNRTLTYVAVKPITVSSKVRIKPGEPVNDVMRTVRRRQLAYRGFIGPEGHPWTEERLELIRAAEEAAEKGPQLGELIKAMAGDQKPIGPEDMTIFPGAVPELFDVPVTKEPELKPEVKKEDPPKKKRRGRPPKKPADTK